MSMFVTVSWFSVAVSITKKAKYNRSNMVKNGKRGYKDAHPAMTQNRDQAPILMYQNSSTRQLHIEIFWCYMQACCHILKNFKIGQASLSLLRAFLILDTTDTETKDFVLGLVKLKILQNYFLFRELYCLWTWPALRRKVTSRDFPGGLKTPHPHLSGLISFIDKYNQLGKNCVKV